ncbi:MAG: DUF4268 domain-containing protein [Candidatus Thorarchaeota archaeon]
MVGKIDRLPLRNIWKHEAHDFTKWLEENIDILNEELDMNLMSAEREKSAGKFSVDLVAEDEGGNPVIIENQLEKSDHDHLGKLITYLTAIGGKTAIWIVADPRPEHVGAISWLNESSSANFYLFKIEGIKIGNSEPAPLLTLIVGPSEESKEVGEKKKELAERHIFRHKFWEALLKLAKEKTKLHANVSPSNYSWVGTGAGKSGLSFYYTVTKHDSKVELYIDRGKDSREENKKIYDQLYSKRDLIEGMFGEPLIWERLDEKRACRISKRFDGGYRDEEKWSNIHDSMIFSMILFEKAFKPHISKLKI